jgi:tRNA(fMet)-specific endonuclease VapC
MIDTDICIYAMKNRPPTLRGRLNRLAEQICVSAITLGEIHYGAELSARRAENLQGIRRFFERLPVLPFTAEAARHFGDLRAELERRGNPVGAYDLLIGAHARAEGLTVVTNNTREFERMPGVRVENWA